MTEMSCNHEWKFFKTLSIEDRQCYFLCPKCKHSLSTDEVAEVLSNLSKLSTARQRILAARDHSKGALIDLESVLQRIDVLST